MSKNLQGSAGGAWLADTLDRTLKMVGQKTTVADHELKQKTKDDFEKGRVVGPMLAAARIGYFSFSQEVKGSCAQECALNLHVGLTGSTVAAQFPLVGADPN